MKVSRAEVPKRSPLVYVSTLARDMTADSSIWAFITLTQSAPVGQETSRDSLLVHHFDKPSSLRANSPRRTRCCMGIPCGLNDATAKAKQRKQTAGSSLQLLKVTRSTPVTLPMVVRSCTTFLSFKSLLNSAPSNSVSKHPGFRHSRSLTISARRMKRPIAGPSNHSVEAILKGTATTNRETPCDGHHPCKQSR